MTNNRKKTVLLLSVIGLLTFAAFAALPSFFGGGLFLDCNKIILSLHTLKGRSVVVYEVSCPLSDDTTVFALEYAGFWNFFSSSKPFFVVEGHGKAAKVRWISDNQLVVTIKGTPRIFKRIFSVDDIAVRYAEIAQ